MTMMDWFYKILCATAGVVIMALIGGAAYDITAVPQVVQANMETPVDNESYPSAAADVTLVSLTDLTKNITIPAVAKVEPAFDPLAGHSPDTNLAITRFCSAERVEASWSIDVGTVSRHFSPDLGTEVLVLKYTTGDWMILTRGSNSDCYPIEAEYVGTGLVSIDVLIAAQP